MCFEVLWVCYLIHRNIMIHPNRVNLRETVQFLFLSVDLWLCVCLYVCTSFESIC